jgi:hypothetical protein
MYIRVASPAMPKLAIVKGGFTNYTGFTSIDIADGSFNLNYLPHDSMGLSALRMIGIYRSGYESLTGLYRVSGCNYTTMITDFFRLWMGKVQDSGAKITDRVAAPQGKYNNAQI